MVMPSYDDLKNSSDLLPFGRGLVLFAPGSTTSHRRRRLIFLSVELVLGSALLWPIFPRIADVEPLVLGLPFSLAWVVASLLSSFAMLVWLFRGEPRDTVEE